tara:strand:+ start:5335 stop:5694 length:360 start_codon:yes stop_codon:yes gene_type:complete
MNPKNYKNFYDDIAKDSEVHRDLVADFVFFFYDKVRKNLSNLTSPKIALPNLGTFSIRTNKLKKNIKRQQDILGNLDKMKFEGYDKSVPVKEKLKNMKSVLEKIESNLENKKKFRNENK